MLDIIGTISLPSLAGLVGVAWIGSSPLERAARLKVALVALLWFATVGVLAASGMFAALGGGTFAIGAAVLTPIGLWIWGARRSAAVRAVALGTPLSIMIALHAGRLLGVFFVLLSHDGRLPPTFALTAGWGDIGVAACAVPLALAAHWRVRGWRTLTLAWNSLAFLDLVTAVTLGIGSAKDTPARFIFETPSTDAMGYLPWVLVPGLLVPMYLLTHIAVFVRLAREGRGVPGAAHTQPRLARQPS